MLRTILLISLAALSLNAFANCEKADSRVEVFSKAKESRKDKYSREDATYLTREAATKKALQDCVMKGAKDCQIISELTFCESKYSNFSNKFGATCTVVVRGYKTSKTKSNGDDFSTLCE